MEDKHQTLGNKIIPNNYKLFIEPNFSTFKYYGEEEIEIEIKNSTKIIKLNATELEVLKAEVILNKKTLNCKIKYDKKNEQVIFSIEKEIKGKAKLKVSFNGFHNDKMSGFYRSSYYYEGKENYFMTTQFEAADARRAFPCFDEPEFKATYELSLLINPNFKAISNMPILSENKVKDKVLVKFMKTLKMSSYLLYIGVGNFEITTEKLGKLTIRLITTPGKKQFAKLPISYAKKFIIFYEKYFGIKYPLPKVDLIAVPDFAAGAMENWGAITFRETALLGDEKTSIANKQRIAEVIAHELTHQWFGDLVTMKWWDDLWLNESFATFMSYKAMDAAFPNWEIKLSYIEAVIASAFAADQLLSTHPISVKVNSVYEIDQIFDEISYEKGGSILNMLEDYVGKDVFRLGLNRYLKKHSYTNATKHDLWGAIEEVAKNKGYNLKVTEVAKSWIEKTGHPYLTVTQNKNVFKISQKRFTLINKKIKKELWDIPINYAFLPKSKTTHQILLDKEKGEIVEKNQNAIKLNIGQKGFYRTLYTKYMLQELGEMIKEQELSPQDSWGIENDLYYFVKKGFFELDEYLEFVSKYCFAAKYPMNLSVLGHLNGLYSLFYNVPGKNKEQIRQLLKDYSNELLKQVGWVRNINESSIITKMRSVAISSSGIAGDISTINKAKKIFNNFINNKKEIDPNIKTSILRVVALNSGIEVFTILKNKYLEETIPIEKIRYLQALGFFKNPEVVKKALEFSLSKEVRLQDSYILPSLYSSNPAVYKLAIEWSYKNWKGLLNKYSRGTHMLPRFVDNFSLITNRMEAKQFEKFFSDKSNMRGDLTNSLKQTKEIIEINTSFVEKTTGR
ncbi:MAG: M1 family metallopeptidase [Candidatus Micrarchaeaceae archaeon]